MAKLDMKVYVVHQALSKHPPLNMLVGTAVICIANRLTARKELCSASRTSVDTLLHRAAKGISCPALGWNVFLIMYSVTSSSIAFACAHGKLSAGVCSNLCCRSAFCTSSSMLYAQWTTLWLLMLAIQTADSCWDLNHAGSPGARQQQQQQQLSTLDKRS